MAEGLLRHFGGNGFEVYSAGIEPKGLNPLAIRAMDELGIDIRSKSVTSYLGQPFQYVITVCDSAKEKCPVFPAGYNFLHWSFEDPAAAQGSDEERLHIFRTVRDPIAARVRQELLTPAGPPGSVIPSFGDQQWSSLPRQ